MSVHMFSHKTGPHYIPHYYKKRMPTPDHIENTQVIKYQICSLIGGATSDQIIVLEGLVHGLLSSYITWQLD